MSNIEYWEKRISRVMREVYNTQEIKNITILRVYKKALKEVKSELSTIYEKMDNPSLSEAYKYNKLNKLEKNIDGIMKELATEEDKFINNSLVDNYTKTFIEISKEIGLDFNFLDKKAIEKAITYPWSGVNYSSRLWDNTDKLSKKLKETITRGLVQGKSYVEMAKEIFNNMNTGAYNSLRLIRTETAHIVNSATMDRYKDSKIIEKVQIWAALDERTCSVCGNEHGKVYNIEDAILLPLHAQCRCCILPAVEL